MGKQAVTVLCDSGSREQARLFAATDGFRRFGKVDSLRTTHVTAAGQRDPVRRGA